MLQTAWSIGFQLRTAQGVGGAKPALEVLLTGVRSLKRRLQIDLQGPCGLTERVRGEVPR